VYNYINKSKGDNMKLSKADQRRLNDAKEMKNPLHIAALIRSDRTGKLTAALKECGLVGGLPV